MSRSLSTAAKAAIYGPQTGEAFLILLKISHASISSLYFVNDAQNVTSTVDGSSQTYLAFPFLIEMPDDTDENVPTVKLMIDNVDRSIMDEIRSTLTGAPTITTWIVLASSPNTIERGPDIFTCRSLEYDQFAIEAELIYEDILNLQFPADSFNPNNFAGIF